MKNVIKKVIYTLLGTFLLATISKPNIIYAAEEELIYIQAFNKLEDGSSVPVVVRDRTTPTEHASADRTFNCADYKTITMEYVASKKSGSTSGTVMGRAYVYVNGTTVNMMEDNNGIENIYNSKTKAITIEPNTGTFRITAEITVWGDKANGYILIKGEKKHTHVYDQKNTADKYLKSAATHASPAVYYYSCSCGEKGTETFTSGSAIPHSYTITHLKNKRFLCHTTHIILYRTTHSTA